MTAARALIGFGQVRHARSRPKAHAFAYPTYFLMLPLRSLREHGHGALARNRRAALAFHDRDHGDGRDDCLAWLDQTLAAHGITDASGEVWLHTYPRVLGYSFKPVSFWYCHRRDGTLRAVLAEASCAAPTTATTARTAPRTAPWPASTTTTSPGPTR